MEPQVDLWFHYYRHHPYILHSPPLELMGRGEIYLLVSSPVQILLEVYI